MKAFCPIVMMLACAWPTMACDPHATLFSGAANAPSDTTLLVHVVQAATLRTDLDARPMGAWIRARLQDGQLDAAWQRLAAATGLSAENLFDHALGCDFTLMVRPAPRQPSGTPATEWAIVSQLNAPDFAHRLVQRVPNTVRAPINGLSVRELPEHDLLIAMDRHRLIAGPSKHPELFDEVLRSFGSRPESSLASNMAFIQARSMPQHGPARGYVAVYARHHASMPGWSVVTASLAGDRVTIHHQSQMHGALTGMPVSLRELDLSPLQSVRSHAVIAVVESGGVSEGAIATMLQWSYPDIAAELRSRFNDRCMLVMSDSDASQPKHNGAEAPSGPTLVCGCEVRESGGTLREVEMSLNRMGRAQATRRATLLSKPAARGLGSIFRPPASAPSAPVNWVCTTGDEQQGWCFFSGDDAELSDIREAVEQVPSPAAIPTRGRWILGGELRGVPLAAHVRAWTAGDSKPGDGSPQPELRAMAGSVAQLLETIDHAAWTVGRPATNRLRIDATMTLVNGPGTGASDHQPAAR